MKGVDNIIVKISRLACFMSPLRRSTTITTSACYLVLHLPSTSRSLGFTRPRSTRAQVLSELPDFWKSVEVKASTSEHNASWNTVGSTSPSTLPLRHLKSIASPRPVFSTLPPYKVSIIVRYC
ncbi:hypothetical protein E2C01_102651 [Portunus trituberculatus]|uniref:Uncharacterized protein n=1 Tax=Portunus trituberculatus TaxID=210409 RepID=A0A5B7K8T4_PORTR|nr:hypothetical protein [Portunus trituberculatus]